MRPATHQISPERQAMLDETLARIEAAFPKRDGLQCVAAWLVKQPNFKFIEMGEDA